MHRVHIIWGCAAYLLSAPLSGEPINLDQAVALAREATSHRILRTEEVAISGEQFAYRIRLIDPDGRMYTVEVDAETGEMREVATGPLILPRGAPPPDYPEPVESSTAEQDPCAS